MINVYYRNNTPLCRKFKKIILQYIKWFSKKYLTNTIKLEVRFVKYLKQFSKETRGISYKNGNKHFVKIIDKYDMSVLHILAHELVHTKQQLEERFVIKNNKLKWEERLYDLKHLNYNRENLPPWEQEAYKMSDKYLLEFFIENGYCKDKYIK